MTNKVDWSNCILPHTVYARYMDNKNLLSISQLVRFDSKLIYGDYNGDIHVVPFNSLITDKNMSDLQLSDMFLGKTHPGLTSAIYQMELSSNSEYLFVNSVRDSCVLQFRLIV